MFLFVCLCPIQIVSGTVTWVSILKQRQTRLRLATNIGKSDSNKSGNILLYCYTIIVCEKHFHSPVRTNIRFYNLFIFVLNHNSCNLNS